MPVHRPQWEYRELVLAQHELLDHEGKVVPLDIIGGPGGQGQVVRALGPLFNFKRPREGSA